MRRLLILLLNLFIFCFSLVGCGTIDAHRVMRVEYHTRILSDEEIRQALQIHFFPIPEYEVMLLQFPGGRNILVNGGNEAVWEQVKDALAQLGVTRIHDLLLTNPEREQLEIVPILQAEYQLEQVAIPAWYGLAWQRLQPSAPLKLLTLQADDVWQFPRGIMIRILSPFEPLSRSPQNNSLVFSLEYGEIQFLYTSNIHTERELQLIQRYELQTVDILKVSDFASIHGSHPLFLEEVDAQIGILFYSEGVHGREEVLERLKENWFNLYETDRHGLITLLITETNYEVILPHQRERR